jgi:hypothetical protein
LFKFTIMVLTDCLRFVKSVEETIEQRLPAVMTNI